MNFLTISPTIKLDKNNEKTVFFSAGWQKKENQRLLDITTMKGNKAIATGENNDITVFDFDVGEKGGRLCGLTFYKKLMKEILKNNPNFKTPQVTTQSGGKHLYFKYQKKFNTATYVMSYKNQEINIDCRNNGGCSFAPPTQIAKDKYYIWDIDFTEAIPQEVPDEMFKYFNNRAFIYEEKKQKLSKKINSNEILHTNIKSVKQVQLVEQDEQVVQLEQDELDEQDEQPAKKIDVTEYDILSNILSLLPKETYEDYNEWLSIGMALHSINSNYIDLWRDFSKKSSKFKEKDMQKWAGFGKKQDQQGYDESYLLKKTLYFVDDGLNIKYSYLISMIFGSEEDHANYYLNLIKNDVRIVNKKQCFIYNKNHCLWLEYNELSFIIAKLSETFKNIFLDCKRYLLNLCFNDFTDATQKYTKLLAKLEKKYLDCTSTRHDKAILSKLIIKEIINDTEFENKLNKISYLLPILSNNVIDLRTAEVMQRTKDHYFSFACPVKYLEKCDFINANRFFSDISNKDDEIKSYLIKRCGYYLTGEINRTFDYWIGIGQNGKSLLCDILKAILYKFFASLAKSVMFQDKQKTSGNQASSYLMLLKKARLGVVGESDYDDVINKTIIKNVTGGDGISARELHTKQDEFVSCTKLIVMTNNDPAEPDIEQAIKDRFNYMSFFQRFGIIPKDGEIKCDPDFAKNLTTLYLNEMFTYIVKYGSVEFYKNKLFETPKRMKRAQNDFFDNHDILQQFINCCYQKTNDINDIVKPVDLYDTFKFWCSESGESFGCYNSTKFGLDVKKKGLEKSPTARKGIKYYIRLRRKEIGEEIDFL